MKVTGIWSLAGAVIFGVIVANLVVNANNTATLANSYLGIQKSALNGLLGKTS